jgi:hypothetical protein
MCVKNKNMSEPNPPVWPSSVLIFSPQDTDIDERIQAATAELQTKAGHFSDKRVALLFRPGTYRIDVLVGYYTQVLGLGNTPHDVKFTSTKYGVYSPAMDPGKAGSLDNFWCGAENITTGCNNMMWAVSQAAPLRRVHVTGNLLLHDKGQYASGGYMSNVRVNGNTEMGSQQQYCSRNCEFAVPPSGGAWSFVYIGCKGAPLAQERSQSSDLGISTVAETPLIAEKPYVTCDPDGFFYLQIPKIQRQTLGVSEERCGTVPFRSVYVTRSDIDTSATIQAKLDQGLHLLLTPGVYYLKETIVVRKHFQVVLGLGLATLVAPVRGPCIMVTNGARDVRIAGLMLEACATMDKNGCLVQYGDTEAEHGSALSGVLSDVFCRVGGANTDKSVSADTMIRLYSSNVVLDNCWLWCCDHSRLQADELPLPTETYHLTVKNEFNCNHGLQVYGHNVYAYGLAVEHTLKDLVQWYGENGHVYFYQSELPYHISQEEYGNEQYVGYRVHEDVESHSATGLGVYCFFRDHHVLVKTAVQTPEHDGIMLDNVFIRFLNGRGGIMSVLNGKGASVTADTEIKLSFI